ncbi:MAG: hypothetical protein CMJ21_00805 [Phycisphaerae bacterium]|nr:hypothetical protein [Phycisphaerae bacterium]
MLIGRIAHPGKTNWVKKITTKGGHPVRHRRIHGAIIIVAMLCATVSCSGIVLAICRPWIPSLPARYRIEDASEIFDMLKSGRNLVAQSPDDAESSLQWAFGLALTQDRQIGRTSGRTNNKVICRV